MLRRVLFALLLAVSMSALAQERGLAVKSAEQAGLSDYNVGRFHALVIGIDNYQRWPKLRTAVSDAKAVAETLRRHYGYADVRTLVDEQATRKGILNALDACAKLTAEDSLLVYYAGHGELDDLKNGYWIPVDAERDSKSEYLPISHIANDYFKKYEVKHLLVVADSCFGGALLRGSVVERPATWKLPAGYQKPSRWVLTSGDLHPVSDGAGGVHSPFAERFLQFLQSADEPAFGVMDLAQYVKKSLDGKPVCEPLETVKHMHGGEFVFCRLDRPLVPSGDTTAKPPALSGGTRSMTPSPQPGNNGKARMTYDELLAELLKRDLPAEKQISCLDDFIKDYPGTTAANDATARIGELRNLAGLRDKAQTRYAELVARDGTEVVTQSDADRRRDSWSTYLTEYEKTGYQMVDARQRMERHAAWKAGPKAGDVQSLDLGGGVQLEMVWIPAGEFMIGSPESETGRDKVETQHRVALTKGFWMGKYEVTQEMWEKVMGKYPSNFKGGQRPVERVSWADCQEFIVRLNGMVSGGGFRLPTEAEWEYACRAGTATGLHNGKEPTSKTGRCPNVDEVAWYSHNSGRTTHPVGQKKANAWGLYDMSGNVWEWCQDWYSDYPFGAVSDPAGPGSGDRRVIRGGSWCNSVGDCRSANRDKHMPGSRGYDLGFRLARGAP